MRLSSLLMLCLFGGTLSACSSSPKKSDNAGIIRADTIVLSLHADSLRPMLQSMQTIGLLPDLHPETLDSLQQSNAWRFFAPAVAERFGTGDSLNRVIGEMRERFAAELPGARFPAIYGIISPYNEAVMTASDTVMLVALNHYLGADYPPYSYFEPYLRRAKRKEALPYHISEAMVQRLYPYGNEEGDALSRMLHEGAVAEAVMHIVPDASAAEAGGWTHEEYQWLLDHEGALWREISGSGLLHSTDAMDITRLVMPAPATMNLRINAPGRAGRFIGWRVVGSWLAKHPGTTIAELLASKRYLDPDFLQQSGYNPGKKAR